MPQIELRYGNRSIPFDHDEDNFTVLSPAKPPAPLTDIQIGEAFDSPIASPPLEELVSPGESVLFVVPDATRQAATGQIVNLLVRRLIANGTMPYETAAIFATGIHRPVTSEEKREILTPFIAQRLKTIDHNARDLMQLVRVGEISGGIPVELNRALTEFDHVVTVGGVGFHYFAGFTGGRKLICPGLASSRTIAATHKLAFDCETLSRRDGVGPGLLNGNAVHEAFTEAASKAKITFAVNTIVNDAGEVAAIFCGAPLDSHYSACEAYAKTNTITIKEKRPVVIASCGGSPFDVNMIQAHKTLETASKACVEGGTIYLLAECSEGLGRADFLDWFGVEDSGELAHRLCARYKVNGQTAWSLLRKAERFDVRIVTELSDEQSSKMRLQRASIADIQKTGQSSQPGYIIPIGSKIDIKTDRH